MALSITIAICTRNRARHLQRALEALVEPLDACREQLDAEVLVVDNGSSDDTPQVVNAMAPRLPLRSASEPRAGLSHARNRACEEAQGDYLAWIDDDVQVTAGWLRGYAAAIRRHPDAAFFGGPISPSLEGRPPPWLTASLGEIGHLYSALDLGPRAHPIVRRRDLPYGANYMVRRRDQLALRYDPQLGRQPGAPWLAGEESAVLAALLDAGREGWWVPEAVVRHVIGRERQTLSYLMAHGYGMGRTDARRKPVAGAGPRLLGRPRWLWSDLLRHTRTAAVARLFHEPPVWAPALHRAAAAAGRLRDQPGGVDPLINESQRSDKRSQE